MLDYFLSLFPLCELNHFSTSMYRQWVPCEPLIQFYANLFETLHMFSPWSFLTSDFMKMYRQWVPCKRNSLHNFSPFFMQLCKSFFHGLKMCTWFGFNPAVNFCHFSTLLTWSFFAGATSTSPKFNLYCWFCHAAAHIMYCIT